MSGLLDNNKLILKDIFGELNAHTDGGDNLCACSQVLITSRN